MIWSPHLELYYPFENQPNDYSGFARHGTVFGSGVYATRPNAGRCLYFDGNGDYVTTPSFALDVSNSVFIFETYIRCKLYVPSVQIIYRDGAFAAPAFCYIFRDANTDDLAVRCNDGAAHAIYTAANFFAGAYDDAWLHMAVVVDFTGKLVRFYRDATLFHTSAPMAGVPVFPSFNRAKYLGTFDFVALMLEEGYLQKTKIWTLPSMPAAAQMLANANRLMLDMNPIW